MNRYGKLCERISKLEDSILDKIGDGYTTYWIINGLQDLVNGIGHLHLFSIPEDKISKLYDKIEEIINELEGIENRLVEEVLAEEVDYDD